MKGWNIRLPFNSLRFKLLLGVFLILLPLIVLLIYQNYYAIHVVRSQVMESNKKMITLYMQLIDKGLEDADEYLLSLASSDPNIQIMDTSDSADNYNLAKINVVNKLSANLTMYKSIESIFVYSNKKDELTDVFKGDQTYAERESVRTYIEKTLGTNKNLNAKFLHRWYVKKIYSDYYLFRFVKSGGIYIGAWVNSKTLLLPLSFIQLGQNGTALFATKEGQPMMFSSFINHNRIDLTRNLQSYYESGKDQKYLVVGQSSKKGNFSLIAIIQDRSILQNLPYLSGLILLIVFLGILLLPAMVIFIRRTFLHPLNRIISTMKDIGDGNVSFRIKEYPTSDEFMIVNRTFNTMMAQIEDLKIHVYEEQLNNQKAQLKHLQLQINPHFFMNSLNILYNLARVQNYQLIQELIMCLVRYFRFMFRSNLTFVALKDELEHVRNYIRIHELRYPNSFSCTIEVDDTVLNTQVPPLIIQTFVENTVKHQVSMDEWTEILIKIERHHDKKQSLNIIIRDTGTGFKEKILMELKAGNQVVDEYGAHIGIWNIQERLRLLYQDEAQISFFNGTPSGAIVQIVLPLNE
ncbi:histidine kinase [Bacillus sp. BRMEA1]|uniref:sensor histidine kinase n=1 Tax=Neobacillus endophyticus TaxID=2738405 RepID=UPI0015655843|nr:histidine kinase [Neobacillus endophyticus]NRD78296.1 histidine kinase [Neobacillus endophyticus]